MAIAEGLAATKTGFDLLKSVVELLRREDLDRNEVIQRLLEIQGLLLHARSALADADEEKSELNRQVVELRRMADLGKDFVRKFGVYWHELDPYCPVCWDVDRKPVRLAGPKDNPRQAGHQDWDCPIHKSAYSLFWNARTQLKESRQQSEEPK